MTRVTESGLRWSGSGVELRLLQAIALFVSGDLDASLEVAQATERRPPDVAAARLAAVSCYAAVARGLPDAARRFDGLRESWAADPQVGLVAGGCEADHLAWAGDSAEAVATADRAQTHLDTEAGEGMYGGLWLSALGLAALADEAACCRQRRDDAGAAAAVEQGDVLLQRVERIVEGGYGRPGGLGTRGPRLAHSRAWPSTPGCRASRPSNGGRRRSTPSATGTSTSRPGATGDWPRRTSRRGIGPPRGPTRRRRQPRRSGWGRSRCSARSPRP